MFPQSKFLSFVGAGGGVYLPQGGWDPGFAAYAHINFGEVLDYIFLHTYINFSSAKKTETFETLSQELTIQHIGIGTKFIGYLNSKPKGFYLGGAISFNIISSEELIFGVDEQSTVVNEVNTTKIGFAGLVGYLLPLKAVSLFIEADYMLASGGYNNLIALAGLNLNL